MVDGARARSLVYNSAFKTGYMFAPALAMVCLSLTGFDGTLTQQSPETNQWLHIYFVLGTFVTFASAALLSQFIRLRKGEIEAAQAYRTAA